MSSGFLSSGEISLIKRDFNAICNGPEGTRVVINHYLPSSALADEAFGSVDTDSERQLASSVSGIGCIQEILVEQKKARHDIVLSFGVMQQGDCIFHFPASRNLKIEQFEALEIVIPGEPNVTWIPIPIRFKELYNYLRYRLGNFQISQFVPCKIKMSK